MCSSTRPNVIPNIKFDGLIISDYMYTLYIRQHYLKKIMLSQLPIYIGIGLLKRLSAYPFVYLMYVFVLCRVFLILHYLL